MNKKSMLTVLGAAVFIMSSAFMAQGSTFRSFVSDTGSDGNTASDCQPAINACRTFQAAIGQTNAGGDVVALSSTGYSAFSINKSITIEGAPGVTAFIFVGAGGAGITVTGASTDLIVLRNIYVDGLGNASTTGLSHTGAAKLAADNCTFRSLTTGISLTNAKMDLRNSTVSGNTTGASVSGTGTDGGAASVATALLTIDGGSISFNGTGLFATNPGANPVFNIFVHALSGNWLTNFVGNTTAISGTGTGCPCTQVGAFSNTQNPK